MTKPAEQIRQRVRALQGRSTDLMLGHHFAQQQIGFLSTLDGYEQGANQRTLLAVEQVAAHQRAQKTTAQAVAKAKVGEQFHALIDKLIEKQVDDIETLYTEVMVIQDTVPTLLDLLATKGVSLSRVELLVKDLPWLGRNLIKLVNLPQYRQQQKSRAVSIDTPELALRYLGLDSLKSVLPTFALRHWLPHSTEPFTLLKRKMRDLAMSRAICAFELAKLNNLNTYQCYTAALLLELGRAALTRTYLRTFEQLLQRRCTLARQENNKPLHDVLVQLEPDPLYLRNLLLTRSVSVTRALVERMQLQRLPISPLLDDYAWCEPEQQDTLSLVLTQADNFSQYHLLNEAHLVEPDEAQLWMNYVKLPQAHVEHLQKSNLKHLILNLDDK